MKIDLSAATRAASRTVLQAKKSSPKLMFAVGIIAVGTGTVLACRATLKVEAVLEKAQSDLADVNTLQHDSYTSQDKLQDKTVIYTRLVLDLGKLYGPAILIGGVGVACLTGSHVILTKRNAALTAAYAGLERTYAAYRERVGEEIGEDREKQLHYEVSKSVLEKDPKVIAEEKKRFKNVSGYARIFDDTNMNWSRLSGNNFLYLKLQQNNFNDRLKAKGHVFLNEVYEQLGFPHTSAGSVTGWIYGDEYADGDQYIDFGIFNKETGNPLDYVNADFINSYEKNIMLDFNVDGIIYDKI